MSRDPEHCADCEAAIVADDDDAGVCIECGGRNRRMRSEVARMDGRDAKALCKVLALFCAVCAVVVLLMPTSTTHGVMLTILVLLTYIFINLGMKPSN